MDEKYQPELNPEPQKQAKTEGFVVKTKYVVLFLAVATGIAGAIISIYAYKKFIPQDNKTLGVNIENISDKPTDEEVKTLTAQLSKIIILPSETPQVITITDLGQYSKNPFFADASFKDRVFLYKNAHKIIVFNPTANKIVNMGPYSPEIPKESTQSAAQQNQQQQNLQLEGASPSPGTTGGQSQPTLDLQSQSN